MFSQKFKILFLLLALTGLSQALEPRTWTNKDGKAVTGTMISKTETTVEVKIGVKRYKLPISSLSEECQKYVAETKIDLPIELDVVTVKASSATARSTSRREISVELNRMKGREMRIEVYWIGEGDTRDDVGLYKKEVRTVKGDTEAFFEVEFPDNNKRGTSKKFDHQHKAYVVLVFHEDLEVESYASMDGMRKYLTDEPEVQ